MPRFIGDLVVRLVSSASNSGRGTWELIVPLQFQSAVLHDFWEHKGAPDADTRARITVPQGFQTDFMSVPPEVPDCARLAEARMAGAVHDYLYTKGAQRLYVPTRELADAILREMYICELDGEGQGGDEVARLDLQARADAVYAGVRLGGAAHWE